MENVLKNLKKIVKKKYILFTSNCTTAIYLTLKSLNIKKKKIIVPVNICYEVIFSIILSDNIPLIVDTNKNLGLSLIDLKNKIISDNDQKILIFPYIYGNSDNFLKILKLINERNIFLIEDIACAMGGKITENRPFGSFGEVTVGSFAQGKIIDMSGGGFFATNKKSIFEKAKKNYHNLSVFSNKKKILNHKTRGIYNEIIRTKKKKIFSKKDSKKNSYGFIYKRNFNNQYFLKLNKKILNLKEINRERAKVSNFYEKKFTFNLCKAVKHQKGSVYWRKNFLFKYNTNNLINKLNENNFYARKYYPPLNHIFSFIKNENFEYENLHERLVNFWVGEEVDKKEIVNAKKLISMYIKKVKKFS